ncbi:MAG TPA: response regulator [Thermoanaerobaculia bacterium]|nr:response regulator [Thermoanaerobaculia bacterium]
MNDRSNVLIAEDDASIRGLLATILQRSGFDVELAVDGCQAVEKLSEQPYDVVLLDLTMPLLDGTEVINFLLRTDPERIRHTIVISARPAGTLQEMSQICRVMAKPFDLYELVGAVRDCAAA